MRYFKGHRNEVTSLSMNPITDQFLSASKDGTVCLWDLANPSAIARISIPLPACKPICNFDSSGIVFGVLVQDSITKVSYLKLYDARNYGQGPFENIFPNMNLVKNALIASNPMMNALQLQRYLHSDLVSFEFSVDGGQSVLVNTNSEAIFLLDGFKPTTEPKVILSRKNEAGLRLGTTFSMDNEYIITGNDEQEILFYDKNSLEAKMTLTGKVTITLVYSQSSSRLLQGMSHQLDVLNAIKPIT
jgi:WD40 repeat protein